MQQERWKPGVTVAAIVEREGRFLLVEEATREGLRLNNPAGHLERGESLLDAVVREALEETTLRFTPEALLGVYLSRFQRAAADEDVTYLRFAFRGRVDEQPVAGRTLDAGIVAVHWLTPDEMRENEGRMRSPLVMRCMLDHQAGRTFPLDTVAADPSVWQPRQL